MSGDRPPVILAAEDFAYGPVARLLDVVSLLDPHHRFRFVGAGTAYEMASCSTHVGECVSLDGVSPENIASALKAATHGALAVVNCMDPLVGEFAASNGLPQVGIDTLLWWWDAPPPFAESCRLYIGQRSIGCDAQIDRMAQAIPNLRIVGPLVPTMPPMQRRDDLLLVNFGGGNAPGWYELGVESNYPATVIRTLIPALMAQPFREVLITGSEAVLTNIRIRAGALPSQFRLASLGRSEFTRAMCACTSLLTVPGLETPLEAWASETPCVFLPPSNASQYFQLEFYRQAGLADDGIDFVPQTTGGCEAIETKTLRARNAAFLEALKEFEGNAELRRSTSASIARQLAAPPAPERGRAFIASLGGRGLQQAAAYVETELAAIARSVTT